jgi:GNAT superfamily N-acetyltransferase
MSSGSTNRLVPIDQSNWRDALRLRVSDEQLPMVADSQPIALVILAKAYVRDGGRRWEPLAYVSPDGTIIAVLALTHAEEVVEVRNLAVDIARQGTGIGTELMGAVLDWSRAQGSTSVELTSTRPTKSQLGFTVAPVSPQLGPRATVSRSGVFLWLARRKSSDTALPEPAIEPTRVLEQVSRAIHAVPEQVLADFSAVDTERVGPRLPWEDLCVESDVVESAIAAVESVAVDLGLLVDNVSIVHNSNKLALRLLPCDVFARVAHSGSEVAALEIDIAQQLSTVEAPVAALERRVTPQVYERDGFAVTWWTFYEATSTGRLPSDTYAEALERFHAGLRTVEADTPHFLDRVKEAERLVWNERLTPALDRADRELLVDTYSSVRREIYRHGAAEQLLHGEPHPGNVLDTAFGPVFIDLETCCRGPIEFDVAHVPPDVAECYSNLDQDLLQECRRLVLAMVAAWRWDARDEFPDGRWHGRNILDLLRNGPPWPTIGELSKV